MKKNKKPLNQSDVDLYDLEDVSGGEKKDLITQREHKATKIEYNPWASNEDDFFNDIKKYINKDPNAPK